MTVKVQPKIFSLLRDPHLVRRYKIEVLLNFVVRTAIRHGVLERGRLSLALTFAITNVSDCNTMRPLQTHYNCYVKRNYKHITIVMRPALGVKPYSDILSLAASSTHCGYTPLPQCREMGMSLGGSRARSCAQGLTVAAAAYV